MKEFSRLERAADSAPDRLEQLRETAGETTPEARERTADLAELRGVLETVPEGLDDDLAEARGALTAELDEGERTAGQEDAARLRALLGG